MNFSGIDRKKLVGRALRALLWLIPKGAILPVLQGPLRGTRWIVGSSNHGCWLGSYEFQKQRLFATLVSPGATVFDIGANAGFYTLLAAVLTGSQGIVVAFEPLPQNVEYLARHLRLNRINNVSIVCAAVGSDMGETRFAANPHSNSMGHIDPSGSLTTPLVSLDGLLTNGSIARPDVMKIDVEGAEYHVLRGAQRLVTIARPTIILATHGDLVHAQCCELLRSWGYDLSAVKSGESVRDTDEILASPPQHDAGLA